MNLRLRWSFKFPGLRIVLILTFCSEQGFLAACELDARKEMSGFRGLGGDL